MKNVFFLNLFMSICIVCKNSVYELGLNILTKCPNPARSIKRIPDPNLVLTASRLAFESYQMFLNILSMTLI